MTQSINNKTNQMKSLFGILTFATFLARIRALTSQEISDLNKLMDLLGIEPEQLDAALDDLLILLQIKLDGTETVGLDTEGIASE